MLIGIRPASDLTWLANDVWRKPSFTTAMRFAVASWHLHTRLVNSGVMPAAAPADLQQTDTPTSWWHTSTTSSSRHGDGPLVGHLLLVPEDVRPPAGREAGVRTLAHLRGHELTFFPMHFSGCRGCRAASSPTRTGSASTAMNLVATIGSSSSAWPRCSSPTPGPLRAARQDRRAEPGRGSDARVVHPRRPRREYTSASADRAQPQPLWESDPVLSKGIPHGKEEELTDTVTFGGATLGETHDGFDAESKMSAHDAGIHLPPPSKLPFLLALAISLFFGGFIVHWAVSVVAAISILFLALAYWLYRFDQRGLSKRKLKKQRLAQVAEAEAAAPPK